MDKFDEKFVGDTGEIVEVDTMAIHSTSKDGKPHSGTADKTKLPSLKGNMLNALLNEKILLRVITC